MALPRRSLDIVAMIKAGASEYTPTITKPSNTRIA
jgi:hypothetical protein